jgi:hypothetical protein
MTAKPMDCGCLERIATTNEGACFGGGESAVSRTHRYALWRVWDRTRPLALFLMLNPSTADETTDDRTINRIVKFAKSWGLGGIIVGNAFALRSAYPEQLLPDPRGAVGEHNDKHLRALLNIAAGRVVLGWGNEIGRRALRFRISELRAIVGESAECLKLSKGGHPSHPLYVSGNARATKYAWPKSGGR